ncbi:MAG: hypothetical protein ACR2GG_04710 [Gemmatimonadaceae bacterium]
MPLVAFSSLPDVSRAWVIGSADPLTTDAEGILLASVDEYLAGWRAHGQALTVGRDSREHHFLTIAVDPTASNASGCSLDALFRVFKGLEQVLGTTLLDRGRVYYRDQTGTVQSTDRAGFSDLAARGIVTSETSVFDTSVQTLGDWRARFEVPAADAWQAALLPRAKR